MENTAAAEQLTLLSVADAMTVSTAAQQLAASPASPRFLLSATTRQRGLQHVAEIRRQLAEAKAVRESSNVQRFSPRKSHAA